MTIPAGLPVTDTTVDLLVVGSGTGMAAALAAHERGLSVLIVPNDLPGLTIRPLQTLARRSVVTTEIFLDNVRVPAANMLGAPGEGFKIIAGAMFTGSPDVQMASSGGTLSNDTNFQNQLAIEEQNLQDDIDDYEIYPVVQAGLTWSF